MPGREDFGILRSRFLTDERAIRAADLYTERGWVREELAFGAVCGHVVQLGLWAMRETDNGILPGDGVAAVHQATMMPRSMCREVINALWMAGLLREAEGGYYLVGFMDCYASIVEQREANREYAKNARAEAKLRRQEEAAKRAAKRAEKLSAPRGTDVGHTENSKRGADVGSTSPPRVGSTSDTTDRAVPALPAVPDRQDRNGTAGNANARSARHDAVGSALASEADASPPATAPVEGAATAPTAGQLVADAERKVVAEALDRLGRRMTSPTAAPAAAAPPKSAALTPQEAAAKALAGRLAEILDPDPRALEALALVAQRPWDDAWCGRAQALLDPLAGFEA